MRFVLILACLLSVFTQSANAQAIQPSIPKNAERFRLTLLRESRMAWGLDAPVASFAAQVQQESSWTEGLTSRTGARGLTQFMPATADWIGTLRPDLANPNPANPVWALRALVVYDKFLWDRVQGRNACERLAFAMSAYNGGLGWVNKRKAKSDAPDSCFGKTCAINPGVTASNQAENQSYPERILHRFEPLYVRSGRWGTGVCT